MAKRTIIAEDDSFAYRITYEAIRRGPQSMHGFYPDMEYEIYDVEIGNSKTTDKWLVVDRDYIPANQWAYLEEQCQEDLAIIGDD